MNWVIWGSLAILILWLVVLSGHAHCLAHFGGCGRVVQPEQVVTVHVPLFGHRIAVFLPGLLQNARSRTSDE